MTGATGGAGGAGAGAGCTTGAEAAGGAAVWAQAAGARTGARTGMAAKLVSLVTLVTLDKKAIGFRWWKRTSIDDSLTVVEL